MVRFFVRGVALVTLLSLLVFAGRLTVVRAQPAFFSLLFPQLVQWLSGDVSGADVQGTPAPGEAVAL